jgi:hypothetical protein
MPKIIVGSCCYSKYSDCELSSVCPECTQSKFENYFELALNLRTKFKQNFVLRIDDFGEEIKCLVKNIKRVEKIGDFRRVESFKGVEFGYELL